MMLLALQIIEDLDDKQFVEDLYLKNQRLLYSTAQKYCFYPEHLDDIIQESFLRMIPKISTIRHLEPPAQISYLLTTIRNTAINYMSREAFWQQIISLDNDLASENIASDSSIDDHVSSTDMLSEIWKDLPFQDQVLLESKYILGYTNEELARQFKCKPDSMRMRLSRARKRALRLLQKKEEKEGKGEVPECHEPS